MVRAILEGRKTQTRRVVKPQPDDSGLHNHTDFPMALDSRLEGWCGTVDETGDFKQYGLPYYPGDVLWVRETFRKVQNYGVDYTIYQYKDEQFSEAWCNGRTREMFIEQSIFGKWKPSIHMPKEAARIWLEIINVRVERLSDISEQDAFAEGIKYRLEKEDMDPYLDGQFKDYKTGHYNLVSSISSFQTLWESINGKSEDDPWVWVIEFKRIEKPKL